MQYATTYLSPVGKIWLTADHMGLTGLWFEGGRHGAPSPAIQGTEGEAPALAGTRQWLDIYFSGREPDFMPPLHMTGTPFCLEVWALLRTIPYGQTTTYGELARQVAQGQGRARMSAQAVGGAVGRNPISILVPCHRVVGKDGSLTGYAGGLARKAGLLAHEGVDMTRLFLPAGLTHTI